MIPAHRRRLFTAVAILVAFDVVIALVIAIALSSNGDEKKAEPRSTLPAFVESSKHHLEPSFKDAARESRLPVALVEALAWRESRWRAEALNPESGAIGIGQLLPETAAFVAGELLGDPTLDPTIARDNIRMTARYLRAQVDQFGGDQQLALAAYLQGSTSVRNTGISATTADYLADIAEIRERFEAAARGDPGSALDSLAS